MNYKAVAIIFLLALPLFAAPIAVANQPIFNVEFRVRPGETRFMGPCLVSTTFPIDLYLWNDKTLTGEGVYAYDFYVYWKNDQGFSLAESMNHIPWPSGKYFLVKNETGTAAWDTTYDFYHLVVTAIGNYIIDPSLELGYTFFNASLVTLTFHIDEEPWWPAKFTSLFAIGNEDGFDATPEDLDSTLAPDVSTGCTIPIINLEIDYGTYLLEVGQPNIDPYPTATAPYAENVTYSANATTESVYIHLTNITGAYGFAFVLKYDNLWKSTDIQHITILPAFAPPFESLHMTVDDGVITVELMKPSEKPTICSKDVAVVKIDFVAMVNEEGQIPITHTSLFTIESATVYVKNDECSTTYVSGCNLFVSGPLKNIFTPKSVADVTFDGIVDVADLATVASKYGAASDYSNLVSPGGNVDVFDVVFVAKRFGDP